MAWLSGWDYRKQITITGQTGAGTNYQVPLNVGESSGATGYDFHLEGHSASFPSDKDDGGDLRFTDDDETTLLDFWVESVSGTSPNRTAKIWVEVKDDLGSNQDIYCYYGNSGASNASDITDTAVNSLGDDFNGTSLDTNKWTATKEGSTSAVAELDGSGNLHLAGASGVISSGNVVSKNTITNDIIIRVRRKYTSEYYPDVSIGDGVLQDITGTQTNWFHTNQGDGYVFVQQQLDGHYIHKTPSNADHINIATDDTNSYGAINTFEIDEFVYDSSGNLKYILNGTQILSGTDTDYLSSSKYVGLHQGEYSNGQGGDSYYDWIFVHKYNNPEPAYNTSGTEENAPSAFTPKIIMF